MRVLYVSKPALISCVLPRDSSPDPSVKGGPIPPDLSVSHRSLLTVPPTGMLFMPGQGSHLGQVDDRKVPRTLPGVGVGGEVEGI